MGDNLKEKTISALKWSTVDRFGQQGVQLLLTLILAQLLSPDDFGTIGVITVFTALSFIMVESGFGQALIRKKDADDKDFSTIFYFNIGLAVVLYLILFFLSSLIANYFHQPVLENLSHLLFISILFNAMYLVPFVKLGARLDYKSIAIVNIISTSLSGITGVSLAFMGFGVWALAWQTVLYHLVRVICFHYIVKWKPVLFFSFHTIKELSSFSLNLLGTGILNIVFSNIYILILGRTFPIKETGYYTQANKFSETSNYTFSSILSGSTYNLFVQIYDQTERLKRVFREAIRKTALIVIPVTLFLIAVAHPLIVTLFRDKWISIVPYYQIICAANLFAPLYMINYNLLNAKGLTKTTFRIEIFRKSAILVSIFICFRWGIIAMLTGYMLVNWLVFFISMLQVKKTIDHYWRNQITDILPGLKIGLVVAICSYSLSFLISLPILLLATQGFLAATLYVFYLKKTENELYNKGINFLKSKWQILNQ